MPFKEYEGMLETLEILADQDFARSIERGLAEAAAGELIGEDEVWGGLDDTVHT
jgi:predicted transcriptional regulator